MSHPPIDLTPAATNPRYGAIPPLLGSANAEYAQTAGRNAGCAADDDSGWRLVSAEVHTFRCPSGCRGGDIERHLEGEISKTPQKRLGN